MNQITALETGKIRDVESEEGRLHGFMHTVSFVVPAYNEEKRIEAVLEDLCRLISLREMNCEVIVSIDGTDGTQKIVEELADQYPFISIARSVNRSGKGSAVRRVSEQVSKDFTFLMDADGAVTADQFLSLLELTSRYDVVIADRYSKRFNNIPLLRRIISKGFNLLVQASLGIRVRDTQSGYKIIRTDLFKKAMRRVGVTNTFFDISLLFHLKRSGARIVECPVLYTHHPDSKFSPLGEIIGQGVSLLAFLVRHSRFSNSIPDIFVIFYRKIFKWI